MTVTSVKGEGGANARAGTHALSLLAIPHNSAVVRALAEGPKAAGEMCRAAGSAPQTTLRGYLRQLATAGIVEKRRAEGFPGAVVYELTACGRDLLEVAGLLAVWLAISPNGPIELGSAEAKHTIKSLVGGWSSSIVRALAARPLSLTELDSLISSLSYPSLERRLLSMRQLGLLEPLSVGGRSTPYALTDWLRRSIVPLAAATRWEHRHFPEQAIPLTNRDIEAAFLMSLPLLRLPEEVSGVCRVGVRRTQGSAASLVGAMAEVRSGILISCSIRLEGTPDAWAVGSTTAWFAAISSSDPRRLELGGDPHLAAEVVGGMHNALFGPHIRLQSDAG